MTCLFPITPILRDEAPKSIQNNFAECLTHLEKFIGALRDAGTMPLWDPAYFAWAQDIDCARDALMQGVSTIRGQSPVHPADVRLQTAALVLDIVLTSSESECVIEALAGGQRDFGFSGNDLRSRESRVLIARFVDLLDSYADLMTADACDDWTSVEERDEILHAVEIMLALEDSEIAAEAGRLH
jgi:hypothetical protein